MHLAGAEGVKKLLPFLDGGIALDDGSLEALADIVQLINVLPDHQQLFAMVPGHQLFHDQGFGL